MVEQISSSGTPTYYHHDYLGSTRALTNASGTVTATFTYSPYGTLAGSTGSQTTPFGFAGEYTDAESGFIYLRARLYDPSTGGFISVDPELKQTRSAYGYACEDPLNATDPSGLFSFKDIAKWAGRQVARAARWAYNHRTEIAVGVGSVVAMLLDRGAKGPRLGAMPKGPGLAGSTLTRHAIEQIVERDISLTEVDNALRHGKQYWDFNHNTISYVNELDSGETVLVARNPKTGTVTTVIKGKGAFHRNAEMQGGGRPRYMPMDVMEN